jgi:hypothetical protein
MHQYTIVLVTGKKGSVRERRKKKEEVEKEKKGSNRLTYTTKFRIEKKEITFD